MKNKIYTVIAIACVLIGSYFVYNTVVTSSDQLSDWITNEFVVVSYDQKLQ